jgi:hypothetical protein
LRVVELALQIGGFERGLGGGLSLSAPPGDDSRVVRQIGR